MSLPPQWASEEGGRISELMKKDRKEDFSVLGLRSNLETMENFLEVNGLKKLIKAFR